MNYLMHKNTLTVVLNGVKKWKVHREFWTAPEERGGMEAHKQEEKKEKDKEKIILVEQETHRKKINLLIDRKNNNKKKKKSVETYATEFREGSFLGLHPISFG